MKTHFVTHSMTLIVVTLLAGFTTTANAQYGPTGPGANNPINSVPPAERAAWLAEVNGSQLEIIPRG